MREYLIKSKWRLCLTIGSFLEYYLCKTATKSGFFKLQMESLSVEK